MKVTELSSDQLDFWVAKARNITLSPAPDGAGVCYQPHPSMTPRKWAPSHLWSQAGPIIEEAKIDLNWDWESSGEWSASLEPDINTQGKTLLQAAMRAYIISKFGDEVEQNSA